ncbi:MAG: hypothetical protein SGBAC_002653 [Bacillariaceae sp.]
MRQWQTCMKIILLVGLYAQQVDAFGTSLKATPLRSATVFRSTRQTIGESDFSKASDGTIGPQTPEIFPDDGEAIFRATDHSSIAEKGSSSRRLLWACMILMFAQFSSKNLPTFSTVSKDVTSAAVTSSFIRTSRGDRKVSANQFLVAALLGWQLVPLAGKLIASASTVISQWSNWYVGILEAFPLVTKACSAAIIGSLGDTCAQQFEERTRVKREGPAAAPIKYDVRRGLSIIADGIFVTGPILHFTYEFLENLIPVTGSALPPSLAALSQVLLDDIFVDSLFVATTFIFTGITEGYGRKKTLSQFKTDFIPTVKAGWAASLILMPLEFTCFRFLPLSLRVFGMNFVDIIWDGVLSFQVHKSRIRMAKEAADACKLAEHETEGATEDLSFAT